MEAAKVADVRYESRPYPCHLSVVIPRKDVVGTDSWTAYPLLRSKEKGEIYHGFLSI